MSQCPNCQKDNKNTTIKGLFCTKLCKDSYNFQNRKVKKRKVFGEVCCICGGDASIFYQTLLVCKQDYHELKEMTPLRLFLLRGKIKK